MLLLAVVAAVAVEAEDSKPPVAAKPSEPAHAAGVNEFVQQLGDKDYYVRQRAQENLARQGFEAFDALSAAAENPDLEIASRAKYLLRLMRVEWTVESDSAEVKRYLRNYELDDAKARVAKMRTLAGLPNAEGTAALCRLVRFEKSSLLSKAAAVALLSERVQREAVALSAAIVETVRKSLGECQRPGALWLLAWTRTSSEPEAVIAEWTKFVDDEQALLRRAPEESSVEIVAGLTRFQIAWLNKLGKIDEAIVVIRRLVDLDRGNPESLAELLDCLMGQKAWKAIDELAVRFRAQFDAEPGLLYALAEAYVDQGQPARGEETAARAFQLYPGKQQKPLIRHFIMAKHLASRGRFAWSRREFDEVIARSDGPEYKELRALAISSLAEMFHDQGQDREAADVLEKLVASIDAGQVNEAELNGRRPSDLRARMHYFTSCHWEHEGDAAKRREALDKALKAEPSDIDVLIACYRLPDQTPEFRGKIVEAIKKSAADTREEIAVDPENPASYNQLAWLVANTEGDLDEALRCSLKSIELLSQLPELKSSEGGFRDTLAHVYFARGEFAKAVAEQSRAAELDPHSGLIQRQLGLFRKKLEETKKP
jgi:tetratricopeptide (TPR) repeat protein